MGLRNLKDCECPEPALDEFTIKPKPPTPVDMLGFRYKCCWCIPLKAATIIICFLTLIWAVVELNGVDKLMANIFPEKGKDFYYTKIFYILLCIILILACGLLLLGILVEKNRVVNLFVWYGFVFNCFYIVLTVSGTIINVMKTGSIKKKQIFPLVMRILWNCLFFYLLMIVNSYKVLIWL